MQDNDDALRAGGGRCLHDFYNVIFVWYVCFLSHWCKIFTFIFIMRSTWQSSDFTDCCVLIMTNYNKHVLFPLLRLAQWLINMSSIVQPDNWMLAYSAEGGIFPYLNLFRDWLRILSEIRTRKLTKFKERKMLFIHQNVWNVFALQANQKK